MIFARLALVLVLTLCVGGCYTRRELAPRAAEPVARIHLRFDVDPALVRDVRGEAARLAREDAAFEAQGAGKPDRRSRADGDAARTAARQAEAETAAMAERLAALLRADLLDKRIAVPVDDPADADLRLEGTFRRGAAGVDLAWRLVAVDGRAAVAAGVASWGVPGAVEPYADAILGKLLATDVDRYARRSVPAPASTPPAPAVAAAATDPRAWAVVIGIDGYREGLPPAAHGEADARAFAAFAGRTLGVPADHVRLLAGARAGKADLESALLEWLPRNVREPGSTVWVYFSGHGAPDPETGDAFLVPWDADPAYLRTRGIALRDLYAALARLPAGRVYVVIDACFSGAGDRSVLAAGTRPLVPIRPPEAPAGVISFAAAGPRETAGAAPGGGHGLFTHHLLAGLGGAADADGDGAVTLGELVGHVTSRVVADARLQNREQRPSLSAPAGLDPGRVILVRGAPR